MLPLDTTFSEKHSRDWAFLPPPVLVRLVDMLKLSSRWRRDGPSLRLLNRHWSEVVDHNVLEVRPHYRRTLVDKDISSLQKFPFLTSVDISRFLVDPPKSITRSYPKKGRSVFRSEWYGTQLEKVVDVLRQLPRLSQIEMSYKALNICHHQCPGAVDQWSKLDAIHSLYCYSFENLKLYGDTPLNTTWIHQSSAPRDASKVLESLVGSFSSLDTVELQANLFSSSTSVKFLEEINSVKLQGVESMKWIESLPNASATVSSVVLRRRMPAAFELLASLGHMKSLGLFVETARDLKNDCLVHLLRQLKVLDLTFTWTISFIPDEVFSSLEQLECLNLNCCAFNGKALKGTLRNLTVLRIKCSCVRDDDVSFLSKLDNLKGLHWVDIRGDQQDWLDLPLHKAMLPNLRLLSISVNKGDSTLKAIAQMQSLEVLFLKPLDSVTVDGLRELERLTKLRILYVSSFLDCSSDKEPISYLLTFDMITKLEQLLLLLPEKILKSLKKCLERIQQKEPQLIVEAGSRSRYSRTRCLAEDAFLI